MVEQAKLFSFRKSLRKTSKNNGRAMRKTNKNNGKSSRKKNGSKTESKKVFRHR